MIVCMYVCMYVFSMFAVLMDRQLMCICMYVCNLVFVYVGIVLYVREEL